jgi:hypothetical protein
MGTKNDPGAFDYYAAAAPDEPMFILLGRDKHAPTLVWLWASLRELDGEDAAKVKEARECALKMMEYASERGRPPVGLAQATIAGLMELIRAVNTATKALTPELRNAATDVDAVRMFLAESTFEKE